MQLLELVQQLPIPGVVRNDVRPSSQSVRSSTTPSRTHPASTRSPTADEQHPVLLAAALSALLFDGPQIQRRFMGRDQRADRAGPPAPEMQAKKPDRVPAWTVSLKS